MSLAPEQRAELLGFVEGLPAEARSLIRDWPPGCVVRTRPDVTLLIPAPGVEGNVVSYFEDGHLGVVAPAAIPHPVHGWGAAEPGMMLRARVVPADLELVREGPVSADEIRQLVDEAEDER